MLVPEVGQIQGESGRISRENLILLLTTQLQRVR